MSSPPEELRDSYEYDEYTLENYEDQQGPPLIQKTSRLIAAVVQNQADVLRDLLDEPRWYGVSDASGYSLLHIAVRRHNVDVFDCMMSIPDFPLEFVDESGNSALVTTLHAHADISDDLGTSEYFTCELIKKGANVPQNCCFSSTPLHCSLARSYFKASPLLMELVDVNIPNYEDGIIPLEYALMVLEEDYLEMLLALLMHGAQPTLDLFEYFVIKGAKYPAIVRETMFLLLADEHSTFEFELDTVLNLATEGFPFVPELIASCHSITFRPGCGYTYLGFLCALRLDFLTLMINKYGSSLSEALFSVELIWPSIAPWRECIFLNNIALLAQSSELRPAMIFLLSHMNKFVTFEFIKNVCHADDAEAIYFYFLSYGLHVNSIDLDLAYRSPPRRYNDFFKILLQMDIQPYERTRIDLMPALSYDVTTNVETWYRTAEQNFYMEHVGLFFRDPRLWDIYTRKKSTEEELKIPLTKDKLPSLAELTRETYRRYFINKHNITTSREFQMYLRQLDISNCIKQIISYETPLYI